MVKELKIPCDFGGQVAPVSLYIGNPNPAQHPLNFQSKWLESERGGTIPQNVMDSFEKIQKLAEQNNVSFEELCYYAITVANKTATKEIPEFNKMLLKLENNTNA